MEYTADQIGYKVREIAGMLVTVTDNEELVSWISDILLGASQDDTCDAQILCDQVKDDLEYR